MTINMKKIGPSWRVTHSPSCRSLRLNFDFQNARLTAMQYVKYAKQRSPGTKLSVFTSMILVTRNRILSKVVIQILFAFSQNK